MFIGGAEEKAPFVNGALDKVGKLDLHETMSVIANSAITLAADTGAGHIAAAYGVPVVSVFGPTAPDEFRPYTERGIVLKNGETTSDVTADEILTATNCLWKNHAETVSH